MKSSHVVTFRSSLPVNGLLVIDDIFFIIRSITSGMSSPIDEFKLSYMKEGLLRLSEQPDATPLNGSVDKYKKSSRYFRSASLCFSSLLLVQAKSYSAVIR